MTAVITAVAVLPLAFMGDEPGTEILRPMAIVILGGLVTSTLYSLFAVPAMYLLFTPSREPSSKTWRSASSASRSCANRLRQSRQVEKEPHPTKVNI